MVKYRKATVLMGGVSSEREVSLRSGAAVAKALREAGREVNEVVLDKASLDGVQLDCDAVFIALHGGYGENGGVQTDLERLGIPYTGPGPAASRLAMDKILTKHALISAGIPAPRFCVVGKDGQAESVNLPFPVVVKPPRDGSSVGLTCPCDKAALPSAIEKARAVDPEVLVEEYIPGREWTVAVIGGEALPVIQISPKSGVYDFESKYTAGATIYEALDETPLTLKCRETALAACKAIGVRGISRVDFRVTDDGAIYVLEINTVPGFTATSLVPKAAAKAGWSFPETCARVLDLATLDTMA